LHGIRDASERWDCTARSDVGPLRDVALAAEKAGFYGIALTEHPVPGAHVPGRFVEESGA
jgi:hypothetical protein